MGSPVWVPLLLAFAAIAITVYLCIWILALCVWIIALALGISGIAALALFICGIAVRNIPYMLAMLGVGLGFIGAALFVSAGALAVSKQIARISTLWMKKALSPFHKDRGNGTTTRPGGNGGFLGALPSNNDDAAGSEHFSAVATADLN